MSLALKPIEVKNKKELISLASGQLKEEPYQFNILDEKVGTKESGYADLIGIDKEGKLTLFYFILSENDTAFVSKALSNYNWACENILNIKKMYPQAAIDTSVSPKITFVSRQFSNQTKKALSFLGIEMASFQYQAFEVNGIPCLYLESVAFQETKKSYWDLELEKLKKEFSGEDALSEEELSEFINFDQESSTEQ